MKHLILSLLLAVSFSTFASYKPSSVPVSVISSKRDIFYFKVDKTFIGAIIEVKNSAGVVVLSQPVNSHKAILDFFLEDAGIYDIAIRKEGKVMEFVYQKNDPLPAWCTDKDRTVTLNEY
jgi:hypothetical protein